MVGTVAECKGQGLAGEPKALFRSLVLAVAHKGSG